MAVTRAFLPDPSSCAQQLRQALPGFVQVDWVDQTGSTNADLIAQARHDPGRMMRPWLLGTHLQSQGRGRAGRTWQNRVGSNLMFSCAFDVFLPARQLPSLAPLLGMAACEALRTQLSHPARLAMKWPNDLLWDHAKLAGILIESSRTSTSAVDDHHLIVVGMGLNLLDARALSQSLQRRIADWSEVAAADIGAAGLQAMDLVRLCAQAWHQALGRATRLGLSELPERFARVDALAGLAVDVIDDGRLRQTGIACGVDASGRLLLRQQQTMHAISVGEISVRVAP